MPEYINDTLDLTTVPFWQWDTTAPMQEVVDLGIPFDSIHRVREIPDTVFRQSLFSHHTLQVHHQGVLPREENAAPTWVFGILLLLTTLLCLYYRQRKIKMTVLLRSTVDVRAMDRLIRDCNLNRSILMLPMGLLTVATVSLPLHHLALPQTGILGYLALTVAISLLYILRNALLRMLGNTFEDRQGINLYITSNYLYHLADATALIALAYLFFYLPGAETTMLYLMAAFLGVAFLMRFVRGVKLFLTHPNSSCFYLFYYLCIVEAIPLLVIIKWFIEQ